MKQASIITYPWIFIPLVFFMRLSKGAGPVDTPAAHQACRFTGLRNAIPLSQNTIPHRQNGIPLSQNTIPQAQNGIRLTQNSIPRPQTPLRM